MPYRYHFIPKRQESHTGAPNRFATINSMRTFIDNALSLLFNDRATIWALKIRRFQMLEFVIIGGGIHGTYLSNCLVGDLGWSADQIRVIDPHDSPCERWKCFTARTAMQYLRSPIVHHLGVSPWDLKNFKRQNRGASWSTSTGSKEHPSLEMFNRHIDWQCAQNGLADLRVKALCTAIHKTSAGLRVVTSAGEFLTRRVILAVSSNDRLAIPSWANHLDSRAKHIFGSAEVLDEIQPGRRLAIVGAGITAAQVALHAAAVSPGKVQLLSRHPLKIAEYDSDPCWMGPKCLHSFAAERDYARRRHIIRASRNKGTVTSDVYQSVKLAEKQGALKILHGEVQQALIQEGGDISLFGPDGHLDDTSRVILATGFISNRPGGALLHQIIDEFDMPIAEDGFPIAQKNLHWKDNIFVTGALAELELGPPARNILGARMAGQRLRNTLLNHQISA
jgi:hypothetical protein